MMNILFIIALCLWERITIGVPQGTVQGPLIILTKMYNYQLDIDIRMMIFFLILE